MGNIGNAITYGGTVAIIGMLIVFIGLIILILCISRSSGVRSISATRRRRKVETAAEIAAAPVAEAVAPEPGRTRRRRRAAHRRDRRRLAACDFRQAPRGAQGAPRGAWKNGPAKSRSSASDSRAVCQSIEPHR